MEPLEDLGLGLGVEVHQRVAADQQVDPGDRRVLDEVVAPEDHRTAQVLAEAVPAALQLEELLELRLGEPFDLRRGVGRVPGLRQRLVVDVGGVDLDPLPERLDPEHVGEEHREAVGLLPGRAAGAPHADRLFGAALGQQGGQHVVAQVVPRVRIAEEPGHVDQDGVEQRDELVGVDLQLVDAVRVAVDLDLAHPAADPAHQAAALVPGEVEAPRLLEVGEHGLELAVGFLGLGHGPTRYPAGRSPVVRGRESSTAHTTLPPAHDRLQPHVRATCVTSFSPMPGSNGDSRSSSTAGRGS